MARKPKPSTLAPQLTVTRRRLEDLVLDERNPNKHPDGNLAAINASLDAFGQVEPLVVQKGTLRVIGGHGRILAMQRRGETEADVVEVDLPDAKADALSIALNHTAKTSVWDNDKLAEFIRSLPEEEHAHTGLDAKALSGLLAKPDTREDEAPAPLPKAVSRAGDLWLLGEHRLICGDCTDAKVVTRLMGEERAVLFATDPPYLVNYDGTGHQRTRGQAKVGKDGKKRYNAAAYAAYTEDGAADGHWDDPNSEKNRDLYDRFIAAAQAHAIRPDAAWYCWHASRRQSMVEAAWIKAGAIPHQQVIWVKSRQVFTRCMLLWQHEPCLVGYAKDQKVPCYQQAGMLAEQHEHAMMGWKQGNKPGLYQRLGDYVSTVWQIPSSEIETTAHPTSKPVRIFGIPMELHTLPGEVCYEPFSGSGSQLSAGEQLGRKVRAIEIAPIFVDVAVRRWQALTGQAATHAETGKTWAQTARQRKVEVPDG